MSATSEHPVLTIRNVELGSGRPKVIVPLTEAHEATLIAAAKRIADSRADMAEWRVDRYAARDDHAKVVKMAERLREEMGDKPLVFTPRTKHEGSDWNPPGDSYRDIIADACACGAIDMVDIQYLNPAVKRCFEAAKAHHVPIIGSHHDFAATPRPEAITDRLNAIASLGADVAKLAVMPIRPADVAALLQATAIAYLTSRVPLITMSMGPLGAISRLSGQVFGSCATFATLGSEGSAPGQLPLDHVLDILELLDRQR